MNGRVTNSQGSAGVQWYPSSDRSQVRSASLTRQYYNHRLLSSHDRLEALMWLLVALLCENHIASLLLLYTQLQVGVAVSHPT